MTNAIYIATTEPHSGKSLVSLGITELLLRKTKKVAIFRPVINAPSAQQRDKNIDVLLSHFDLDIDYDDTYAFLRREATELIAQGQYNEMLDKIILKYKFLESQYDFVLCIGSDFEGAGTAFEFDVNADIAKNLGCPVLVVGSGAHREIATVINTVNVSLDAFLGRGCQVLGVVVNRADPAQVEALAGALQRDLTQHDGVISAVIPEHQILSSPTVAEIANQLNAEILYGDPHLDRLVHRYLIIAMEIHNYLPYLSDDALLITPGDRSDVIQSLCPPAQSSQSNRHRGGQANLPQSRSGSRFRHRLSPDAAPRGLPLRHSQLAVRRARDSSLWLSRDVSFVCRQPSHKLFGQASRRNEPHHNSSG